MRDKAASGMKLKHETTNIDASVVRHPCETIGRCGAHQSSFAAVAITPFAGQMLFSNANMCLP